MASVGVKYPVIADLTETTTAVHSNGRVLSKAIRVDTSYDFNDVELYADDVLQESDRSFQSGTVTVEGDALSDKVIKDLCGHTTAGGGYVANTKDMGRYVGHGFYGKQNGGTYKAIWYPKVLFTDPNESLQTRGQSTEYKTPVIEGKIHADVEGNWKFKETFASEVLAKAWLDAKAQIVATAVEPKSTVQSGTYTTAQNVVLTTTEPSGEIYYTIDGTVPTATNGTKYTAAVVCAKPSNKCIKAVTIAAGKANSRPIELLIVITA